VPAPAPPPAVAAPEPTATVDAGLAAAAATTTELAPHPAVPAEDESPWDPPRRYDEPPRGGRRPVLVVAVTMVAVVLLGALGWVASRPVLDWRRADRLAARRAEALRAARTLALNIGSLDHKNLDRDLTRIAESTTGEAREEFDAKILKNDAYKALVKENEATLTSTVQRIGLEPCGSDDTACRDGKRVVVLVFYDQESRNKLRPTPRVDRNRVALTLVRSHGKWLISDVAVV
ncbi:MAG TPA: hypothetical protein VFQ85_06900, partial [Mycobacteriales bacterium]|nr:hypothetical protein [Mycobacteriales bacterium]